MGEPASVIIPMSPLGWPLRLSQQALSAFLEGLRRHGRFRIGGLRQQAWTSLAGLPASQRCEAVQWLALQLQVGIDAGDSQRRAECHALVNSVDPALLSLLHAAAPLQGNKPDTRTRNRSMMAAMT